MSILVVVLYGPRGKLPDNLPISDSHHVPIHHRVYKSLKLQVDRFLFLSITKLVPFDIW